MAANANTLPGTQLTGDELKDLETLVQQSVEAKYAELNKNQPKTDGDGKPEPIKITVFGKEHTFETAEAASKAIEEAMTLVQQNTAQQVQQQAKPTTTTIKEEPAFDREKFATLVADDPLKGLDYALGAMLFDGKVEGAAATLKKQLADLGTQKMVLTGYQFREAFPNFPSTPDNLAKLEQIRAGLGLPPDSAQSWEAAYSVGVMRGLLPPPTAPQQQQQQRQEPDEFRYTGNPHAIPPRMGRQQTQEVPNWVKKAEDLPIEDLEKLIRDLSGGR